MSTCIFGVCSSTWNSTKAHANASYKGSYKKGGAKGGRYLDEDVVQEDGLLLEAIGVGIVDDSGIDDDLTAGSFADGDEETTLTGATDNLKTFGRPYGDDSGIRSVDF